MAVTKEKKQELIKLYGKSDKDSGAIEVQVALANHEVKALAEHIKLHPKDNHNKKGLLACISKQKRLLKYLQRSDYERYKNIIKKLNIRK